MTRLQKVRHRIGHMAHWAHEPSHLVYLAAVGWEAHGLYGLAAWACLGISIVGHFMSYEVPAVEL